MLSKFAILDLQLFMNVHERQFELIQMSSLSIQSVEFVSSAITDIDHQVITSFLRRPLSLKGMPGLLV